MKICPHCGTRNYDVRIERVKSNDQFPCHSCGKNMYQMGTCQPVSEQEIISASSETRLHIPLSEER